MFEFEIININRNIWIYAEESIGYWIKQIYDPKKNFYIDKGNAEQYNSQK